MHNLSNGTYNLNIFVDCGVEISVEYLTIFLTKKPLGLNPNPLGLEQLGRSLYRLL